MPQGRRHLLWLLPLLAVGCDGPPPQPETPAPPAELGQHFDPSATGTIAGRMVWTGPIPEIASFRSPPTPAQPAPRPPFRSFPNPHTPRIDRASSGMGDVAVCLHGVDLVRSRPWDHPPVRVEQRKLQLLICQDARPSRLGFVRRGETVEMISCDAIYHVMRIRGVDYFSIPFPEPNTPRMRTMKHTGPVELSSGSGRFWMRGYLFVTEHPYGTRTDKQGGFRLEQVPEGDYELTMWMPNWHVAEIDHDPGSNLAARVRFHPPLELRRRVKVRRGEIIRLDLSVSASDFEPR